MLAFAFGDSDSDSVLLSDRGGSDVKGRLAVRGSIRTLGELLGKLAFALGALMFLVMSVRFDDYSRSNSKGNSETKEEMHSG